MDSMEPQTPDSEQGSRHPLPRWVIALVAAMEISEDEHPKYFADTALYGMVQLDRCPESRFLALVPEDVRASARRWIGH